MATARKPKDERYRERCFPGAEQEVLQTKQGGFIPLPIVTRKMMNHLRDHELRVWLYLQLRASKWFICYPTYEEIVRESGVRSKGTVSKAIRELERKGFIRSYNDSGVRRYLLRDPRMAAEQLAKLGILTGDGLEEINDLLDQLNLELVQQPKKKPTILRPQQAQGSLP